MYIYVNLTRCVIWVILLLSRVTIYRLTQTFGLKISVCTKRRFYSRMSNLSRHSDALYT